RRRPDRHLRHVVTDERELVFARGHGGERRRVDHAVDALDAAVDGLRGELQRIAAIAAQRLPPEPEDARLEARELAGERALRGGDVAPLDEDPLLDRDADRLARRRGERRRGGPALDRSDRGALAAGPEDEAIADVHRAR